MQVIAIFAESKVGPQRGAYRRRTRQRPRRSCCCDVPFLGARPCTVPRASPQHPACAHLARLAAPSPQIQWPPELLSLFNILSAFNLNIEIVAPECLIPKLAYTNKCAGPCEIAGGGLLLHNRAQSTAAPALPLFWRRLATRRRWAFIMVLPLGIIAVFGLCHIGFTAYKRVVLGRTRNLQQHSGSFVSSTFMLVRRARPRLAAPSVSCLKFLRRAALSHQTSAAPSRRPIVVP
jgi:hypothetical protein